MTPNPEGQDLWKYRRRLIFSCTFGCFAGLAYLLVFGNETRLHENIADGLMWLLTVTVTSYTLGAVVDDWLQRREKRLEPRN